MASFTDEEINELFDASDIIIDSIITPTPNVPSTVGKSAIPKGNTRVKTDAWEAYQAQKDEGTITPTKTISPSGTPGGAAPASQDTTSGSIQTTSPSQNVTEGPSTGFLASIDKMAGKNYDTHLKKGSDTLSPNNGLPSGTPKPQGPLTQPLGQGSNLDIAGSTQSHGRMGELHLSPGVTPGVPLSPQCQPSMSVAAGHAQVSADYASEMRQVLDAIMSRLSRMEQAVDSIHKGIAVIPNIRNDVQLIKTTVATMEGTLSMIKLMDPGNATISSLNDLRKSAVSTPVVISGPGDPAPYLHESQYMGLDKLARPVDDLRKLTTKSEPQGKDFVTEKETIASMIRAKPLQDATSKRLLSRLDQCTTMEELKKLKRGVLNN
uniref:Phosphoprotein n=1 Tax=Avulavirus sp. TaxID=2493083 RepID=A0A481XY33_9MONO|nr:P [Avulavirus sp.] [Avulavirus sp.]